MSLELQNLDCNCNNCKYFIRDIDLTKNNNKYIRDKSSTIHYGFCDFKNQNIAEISNILLIHTQKCFINRKS